MYILFVFFIPSILGLKIIDYFNKGLNLKNTIYAYVYLVFFSFVFNITFSYKLFGVTGDVLQILNYYPMLFVKMALVSIIINIILAIIWLTVQKNMQFKLEVVGINNEKKDKKIVKNNRKSSTKVRKTTIKDSKKNKDK